MRNKGDYDNVDTGKVVSDGLAALYAKTLSWRLVGMAIGKSGTYARLIARGERRPTEAVCAAWHEWRKAVAPPRARRRYIRPCLDTDPEVRMGQLRRLLAEAEEAHREAR